MSLVSLWLVDHPDVLKFPKISGYRERRDGAQDPVICLSPPMNRRKRCKDCVLALLAT